MEDFTDTDPRVMKVWLEMLHAKTPGERILMAFELSDFAVSSGRIRRTREIPQGVGT